MFWNRNAPRKHCGEDVVRHYAAFPVELARRVILAATSARGVCSYCSRPWVRVVEKGEPELAANTWSPEGGGSYDSNDKAFSARGPASTLKHVRTTKTIGWEPTCDCGDIPETPASVLDPFGGSGTTLLAARELDRNATMIELSPDYCDLAEARLAYPVPAELPLDAA